MTEATLTKEAPAVDRATVERIRLMAVLLAITALGAAVGGIFWPVAADGGDTYSYADIADRRDLWWGLLAFLAVNGIVNVMLQAVAVLVLVRERGSRWATVGAALMWVGIATQAVGVAGWQSAYFYATDPGVDPAAGRAVVEAANADQAHLFPLLIAGALLVMIGTVLQVVALFRAKAVPVWVPIAALFAIITFLVPAEGLVGLVTSIPMAAAAFGLGYFAVRKVSA